MKPTEYEDVDELTDDEEDSDEWYEGQGWPPQDS